MSEIIQRVHIGDLLDKNDRLHEVKMTLDETVDNTGYVEWQNEDFELAGEYVTYTELVDMFGAAKVDAFIEEATKNAR